MAFLAPIGAAIMEALPAIGAGAGATAAGTGLGAAAGAGATAAGSALASEGLLSGLAGALGSGATAATGMEALAPSLAGALGSGATAGATGLEALAPSLGGTLLGSGGGETLSMASPSLLAQLGLDTPKNLVSATNQGIETLAKLKSMNQRSPYAVGPNLHPGTPTAGVKLASAVQRRSTPLEEFALLLRRAGA